MRKVVLVFLLFVPCILLAQKQTSIEALLKSIQNTKTDTLKVKQLHKIALYYIDSDVVKATFYAQKALQLAQELNWKEGVSQSNFYLGSVYNAHFNYDKALAYFQKSLNTSSRKLISKTYLNIGGIHLNKSDFSKALDYFHRALKIDEALGNQKETAKISANIGSVYYGMQHYPKALLFFHKAAKINQETGNILDLAIVNRNIAGVFNSLKQPQKALDYYETANQLSKKSNNESLQARILSDIALVYFNLEDYDKAIINSHLSLQAITNDAQDKQILAFTHGVLGDAYLEKARSNHHKQVFLDSAISSLNKAVKLHQQLNSNRDLAYDFSSITEVYKLRGDYKSALTSYETAMVYEDSVFNFDNKESIKNLEDKRSIEIRDREIKINKLQLEAKEKQKWMLFAGLVLLGIIVGMLFYQSSNRRKINKKLQVLNLNLEQKNTELDQANKIKARFFSILNHDLRSPVYNLIHFLHLQKESPELLDDDTKAAIQKKTMLSAENLVTSMEDMLLWSKGQMENFKPQPAKIAVSELFEDIHKHFSSEEKVDFTFENKQNITLFTDENYLKTIIRNLTGNAIKALDGFAPRNNEKPTIHWKAWQESNQTFLSITDNGPGGTQEQFRALYDETEVVGIQTGLGLHLIRDLARSIHCVIAVKSNPNEGTVFILQFK